MSESADATSQGTSPRLGLAEGILIPVVAYLVSTVVTLLVFSAVSAKASTAISSAALLAVSYALVSKAVSSPLRCVGLRGVRPRLVLYSVVASFALILPAMSLEAVFMSRFEIPQDWVEYLNEIVRAGSVRELIYAWVVAALLAAISEEFVFRGVLQNSLTTRLPGWLAVVLVSGVFAALHTWRFAVAFVLGLFLGFLYLRTRSLLTSVIAHLAINSVVVFATYVVEKKGEAYLPAWVKEEKPAPALMIAVSICIFFLLMAQVWKLTSGTPEEPVSPYSGERHTVDIV